MLKQLYKTAIIATLFVLSACASGSNFNSPIELIDRMEGKTFSIQSDRRAVGYIRVSNGYFSAISIKTGSVHYGTASVSTFGNESQYLKIALASKDGAVNFKSYPDLLSSTDQIALIEILHYGATKHGRGIARMGFPKEFYTKPPKALAWDAAQTRHAFNNTNQFFILTETMAQNVFSEQLKVALRQARAQGYVKPTTDSRVTPSLIIRANKQRRGRVNESSSHILGFDPGAAIISIYAVSIQDHLSRSGIESSAVNNAKNNKEKVLKAIDTLKESWSQVENNTVAVGGAMAAASNELSEGNACQAALSRELMELMAQVSKIGEVAKGQIRPLNKLENDLQNSSGLAYSETFFKGILAVYGLMTSGGAENEVAVASDGLREVKILASRDKRIAHSETTIKNSALNYQYATGQLKLVQIKIAELEKKERGC